jgi:DNA invertase Pin-like site-specific DNA recombinase
MTALAPLSYSYVRFSTREQIRGDSLRRQTAAAKEWADKHGARLDTTTTLHDLGRSAFKGGHRKNADRNALAGFLKLVEDRKVPRGSFLIIEALDRLTREDIQPALLLVLGLLQAGVRVVQLKPVEVVYDDRSDAMAVMMMIMELARGNSESKVKSDRVGEAWASKRKAVRDDGELLTRRLPAWVQRVGDDLILIPERADVVRRVFALSAAGHGHIGIIKRLNAEKVPPFGKLASEEEIAEYARQRSDAGEAPFTTEDVAAMRTTLGRWEGRAWVPAHWSRSYVGALLRDRRVLGEFQPCRGRRPEGTAVKDYFPAVLGEAEFLVARVGATARGGFERQADGNFVGKRGGPQGRQGEHQNVFAGLLRHARDGDTMYITQKTDKSGGRTVSRRVLINTKRAPCYSFPAEPFEEALLSLLAEVDPREVLGEPGDGPDLVAVLACKLAQVRQELDGLVEAKGESDSHRLGQMILKREAEEKELDDRLAAARLEAASPLGEGWAEAQTLLAALAAAADPQAARVRLRSVLRRILAGVWVLTVPRGKDRVAAVQCWFHGGERCRSILIVSRPPSANGSGRQEGHWRAWSFAAAAVPGDLDLRERSHAASLAKDLAVLDPSALLEV